MRWIHLAAFIGTHLIRLLSGLPIPRSLYFLIHDNTEPWLRRWCECRPCCRCRTWRQDIYNASPTLIRLALLLAPRR